MGNQESRNHYFCCGANPEDYDEGLEDPRNNTFDKNNMNTASEIDHSGDYVKASIVVEDKKEKERSSFEKVTSLKKDLAVNKKEEEEENKKEEGNKLRSAKPKREENIEDNKNEEEKEKKETIEDKKDENKNEEDNKEKLNLSKHYSRTSNNDGNSDDMVSIKSEADASEFDNRSFHSVHSIKSEAPKKEKEINLNLIIPEKYIREDEKGLITYTKEGLIEFLNELENLPKEEMVNKDNLTLKICREGSKITRTVPMMVSEYKFYKNRFKKTPSLELFRKVFLGKDLRIRWENTIKSIDILEQISPDVYISHIVSKKQLVVAERDFIDKNVEFSDGGKLYRFCATIPEDLMNKNPNRVVSTTYFNYGIYSDEGDYFVYKNVYQNDFGIKTPDFAIKYVMPGTMINLYKEYIKIVDDVMEKESA
ncbi:MAG: START domain-containing protein [archaeon]|nr:START domain-containing protein [archaeon]